MPEIGKYNDLRVKSIASIGIYLTDGEEDVLLPKRYVQDELKVGDTVTVFVYLDNENRPVATTEDPYAEVDEFVFLEVKEVNDYGAFLDWGISKDLFVAFSEQRKEMKPGESHLVYVFIDEKSGRIAASAKWSRFVLPPDDFKEGEEVELLIAEKTNIGWRAIIENMSEGIIYENEVFRPMKPGDTVRGYIRLIRDDGKVDLRLQPEGYTNVEEAASRITHYLKEHNGRLPLSDDSPADEIYRILKMSKKTFKRAIGGLYKKRIVELGDGEVRLSSEE